MKITTKKGSELEKSEIDLMTGARIKEYGKNTKNFLNENESVFFFVYDKNKIVSFGMLKPIKIEFQGKNYEILGISNIISIIKNKGYGKILVKEMIKYLKKRGKTGLGFCDCKISGFYEKSGLKVEKDLARKFRYKYASREEEKKELEEGGDGIYYEGKDRFIETILKTKSLVYIEVPFW